MAHTIAFNTELGVIVLRAKKSMDADELEEALREIVHLPDFEEGLRLVLDMREGCLEMTGEEIRAVAVSTEALDDRWGSTKWSFLAPNDAVYGLGRMFMALTDRHRVESRVFRTMGEADDWLGLGVEMNEILERTPE